MASSRAPYVLEPLIPEQSKYRRENKPIYSIGQGLAELAGDLGSAWLEKRQMSEEEAKQEQMARLLAEAYSTVNNPELAKDPASGAVYSAQDLAGINYGRSPIVDPNDGAPGPAPTGMRPASRVSADITPMTAPQRFQEAMNQLVKANPRLAAQSMEGLMTASRAAQPPPRLVDEKIAGGGFGQRHPITNELKVVTQPDFVQTPGGLEARIAVSAAGRPINTVDMRQENEEAKAFGSYLTENFAKNISPRAQAARDARNNIMIARNIKDLPGGALEPLKARVGALAEAFGVSKDALVAMGFDKATDAQAFTGIMQNLVITKMQAQKGPQTENDAKRIEMTVASLGNTPEAREFLLRSATELAERDIMAEEFYLEWREKNKTFDGAQRAWNKYMGDVPMSGRNPNSNLPVFFSEFVEDAKRATLEANGEEPSFEDLKAEWKRKYGGKATNR